MVRIVRNGFTSSGHCCEWCGSYRDGQGPFALFQIQALLEDKLEPKRFNVCDGCLDELGDWIRGALTELEPEKKARDDLWEKSKTLKLRKTSARKQRRKPRRPASRRAPSQTTEGSVDAPKRRGKSRRR